MNSPKSIVELEFGGEFDRALRKELDGEKVTGMMLTGSYARREQTRYSDVDILRFNEDGSETAENGYVLRIFKDRLVSVTDTTVNAKLEQLKNPSRCFYAVPGIRQAAILLDKKGEIEKLKQKAIDFNWEAISAKADEYSSSLLMGCSEEVCKILSGFTRNDWSAILAGSLGIVLMLLVALAVRRRMLFISENAFFRDIISSAGENSEWTRAFRVCAGISNPQDDQDSIKSRGAAALNVYLATEQLLNSIIRADHKEVINEAVRTIRNSGIFSKQEESVLLSA